MTPHELQVWLMASGKRSITDAWQASRLHRSKKHPELSTLTKQFDPKLNQQAESHAKHQSAFDYFHLMATQRQASEDAKPA